MFTKSDKSWLKKNFATKGVLKDLVTKDDLIGLARSNELDELKITFTDNLAKWKSELFDKIDKVLGQLKSCEQEKEILQAKEDTRGELASRIEKLEKIHPHSGHQI